MAAARKRRARRRLAVRIGLAAVVIVAVGLGISALQGDEEQEVTSTNTTTTALPVTESAAGKPCVAMAGAPPAGAPNVAVKVGPPPTALIKEDIKVGTGAPVTANATPSVHYIGVACSTGKVFDSSYGRGQPLALPLNQLIPGWQEGIAGMNVGGQRLLGIPADKAYGSTGRPPDIAPDEALWFVVEVVDTKGG